MTKLKKKQKKIRYEIEKKINQKNGEKQNKYIKRKRTKSNIKTKKMLWL